MCQIFRPVIAQIIISGKNEGRERGFFFYLPLFGSGPLVNDDRYLGGSEGLKGVFKDGKASKEAKGRALELARRVSEPDERASKPAERALDPAERASKQAKWASKQAGRATKPTWRASEPALMASEPAERASEPAGRASKGARNLCCKCGYRLNYGQKLFC